MDDHVLDLLVRELGVNEREVYRLPAPLDLTRAQPRRRPRPLRPALPAVRPADAPATWPPSRRSKAPRHPRRRARHATSCCSTPTTRSRPRCRRSSSRPRPTRKVLAIKQTLYRTSGDSPDRRRPHRRRRGRQAGAGHRRDQGPLRRAGQHLLGPQAGAGRRPRRLRHRRAQDPRQALPGRPPGGRGPAPLLPHRHRQLQPARPPASTRTSACSPPTRRSARTSARLFNQLSGFAPRSKFKRLLVAPRSVRSGLIERIDAEIGPRRGRARPAASGIKLNSIVDEQIIDALYRASQAGVPVDIWVRGICALRPGVPGLSENIRVRSVLGRFLEHSRVFLVRRRRRARGLHRQRRHDAPQPRPPGRGARCASPTAGTSPTLAVADRRAA